MHRRSHAANAALQAGALQSKSIKSLFYNVFRCSSLDTNPRACVNFTITSLSGRTGNPGNDRSVGFASAFGIAKMRRWSVDFGAFAQYGKQLKETVI